MCKKILEKAITFYPVPVVMLSCGDFDGEKNITTVSWTGILNSNPHMVYASVRPERHSYKLIKDSGEFVINLITRDLVYKADFCGTNSGKDIDKFSVASLTPEKASVVKCPVIKESPINIECKVDRVLELGSHHMFIANVVSSMVDEKLIKENNKLDFYNDDFIVYLNREYFNTGDFIGKNSFSKLN